MPERKKTIHLVILYVIVIALAVYVLSGQNAAHQAVPTNSSNMSWVCLKQECASSVPGGTVWAQQNCGLVNTTNGSVEACRVTINGQTQLVRKDALNLSVIRQCTEYRCLEDVQVRHVNYTLPGAQ